MGRANRYEEVGGNGPWRPIRGAQPDGRRGVPGWSGQLDATEMNGALIGTGEAACLAAMVVMGAVPVTGVCRGGARRRRAPRHGTPGERAEREAGRDNRGEYGARQGSHSGNVAVNGRPGKMGFLGE